MEKMIKVINDNLENVINGIKEHKLDLETTLDTVRSEMSVQVTEANTYKSDVENARTIISSLEDEITELETDLEELNKKFGSRNFKEIVEAGNREITAKIEEKKTQINEQGQVILALTEKARRLKDSLIELREKKIQNEENLYKTRVLLGYYETRIKDIIKFSLDNPNELESYKDEIPQEELNTQEDIDIMAIIDGSIFEEIDEISAGEPDAELLKSVLENPDNIPVYVQEEEEVIEEEEVTTANQLENMISDAKAFMEKNADLLQQEEDTDEDADESSTSGVVEDNKEVLKAIDEVKEALKEEKHEDVIVEEENNEDLTNIFNDNLSNDVPLDIEGLQKELDAEEETEDAIDINVDEDDILPYESSNSLIASADDFTNVVDDVDKKLEECGIDLGKLSEDDLILLKSSYDKDTIPKSIEVLNKHDISIDNIYKNVRVLTAITPQNLEKILDLLRKTGATIIDLNLVCEYLDNVNINKLEQVVSSGNVNLTSALVESLPENIDDVIGKVLGLDKKDSEILKKNASKEEYRIMNALPNVIKANYEEILKLNVNDSNVIISKYPHRFTLPYSEFFEILDKYDTEDLIRCINKNAAVIDKL